MKLKKIDQQNISETAARKLVELIWRFKMPNLNLHERRAIMNLYWNWDDKQLTAGQKYLILLLFNKTKIKYDTITNSI